MSGAQISDLSVLFRSAEESCKQTLSRPDSALSFVIMPVQRCIHLGCREASSAFKNVQKYMCKLQAMLGVGEAQGRCVSGLTQDSPESMTSFVTPILLITQNLNLCARSDILVSTSPLT